NGTITLEIEGQNDNAGGFVAVFVGDELRGVAERMYFPFGDSYMYSLMVYSNVTEGEKLTFKYYNNTTNEIIAFGESLEFISDMIVGDGFDTFKLSRKIQDTLPDSYSISEPYPNPFNPVTTFRYSIPEDGLVQLSIFDISGRKIYEILNQETSAGNYSAEWNADEYSSGVYIIKMVANEVISTQKIALIK
ncbi:MAG: T9SS type A sorting domain-containing protein, partial [Candidatus Marinimicrobia bacterium]|nr:T9SS type A sorting domain-containing protein [Candidatus Neomarinimicrobiota bacterium]